MSNKIIRLEILRMKERQFFILYNRGEQTIGGGGEATRDEAGEA